MKRQRHRTDALQFSKPLVLECFLDSTDTATEYHRCSNYPHESRDPRNLSKETFLIKLTFLNKKSIVAVLRLTLLSTPVSIWRPMQSEVSSDNKVVSAKKKVTTYAQSRSQFREPNCLKRV